MIYCLLGLLGTEQLMKFGGCGWHFSFLQIVQQSEKLIYYYQSDFFVLHFLDLFLILLPQTLSVNFD